MIVFDPVKGRTRVSNELPFTVLLHRDVPSCEETRLTLIDSSGPAAGEMIATWPLLIPKDEALCPLETPGSLWGGVKVRDLRRIEDGGDAAARRLPFRDARSSAAHNS